MQIVLTVEGDKPRVLSKSTVFLPDLKRFMTSNFNSKRVHFLHFALIFLRNFLLRTYFLFHSTILKITYLTELNGNSAFYTQIEKFFKYDYDLSEKIKSYVATQIEIIKTQSGFNQFLKSGPNRTDANRGSSVYFFCRIDGIHVIVEFELLVLLMKTTWFVMGEQLFCLISNNFCISKNDFYVLNCSQYNC